MQYCPKCGNKVDDSMHFCSNCGLQLKDATPNQTATSQPQNQTMHEHHRKVDHGFVSFLAGGLILVTIGVVAILELTNNLLEPGQYLVIMLTAIGLIVIFSAFYVFLGSYRHSHAIHHSLVA